MEETVGRKPLVRDLNAHLICVLCGGYYVDATTIVECLHSFCRSCIVRHLETSKFCPICDVQVHKARPLHSIRSDRTLQTLVYKLVPGLYQTEMQRRREFNASSSSSDLQADPGFFSPEDSISLSLEYYDSDKDDEEEAENRTENEIEKNKQMPHRRYLQCPAAVSMKHLKKFIRMKYGLGSEHRVDIIYSGECLRDDFCLMDVAYTFSWKRIAPMRFSYRIFHPPVYVPVAPPPLPPPPPPPPPPQVPNTSQPEQQQQQHQQDIHPELDDHPNKQDQSASPSHSVSVSGNSDTVMNVVETDSNASVKGAGACSETSAPSPEEIISVEGTVLQDDTSEPETKKMKLCVDVGEECRENTDTNGTKPQEEEKVEQETEVDEKKQKRRRKRSSNSDQENRDDESSSGTAAAIACDVAANASPRSEEINANEGASLPTVQTHDEASSEEPVVKETCIASEETGETATLQEEEAIVEDSRCVENDSTAAESVVDSVVIEESAVDEGDTSITKDGEDDDKEDDFTLRMSSSEEEEGGDVDEGLTTKIVPKEEDMKEDNQVKELEERKKLKVKKDGRKKSKHKSKHHHQESSARKRKAHRSESTPTILQYQEDVMKLKVKLGPIKPMMPHRHHHHHHHSKHNRKNQLEADASSANVNLRSNGESSSSVTTTTSAKERLLQMRAVRHKNISTTKITSTPAPSAPAKDDANNRVKKTEILMPPSSITVSKVNISDKRKFEIQKTSSGSSCGGEESKKPSLEIMLVNTSSTVTVSTTCITPTTTTTSANNTTTDVCATVRHSGNDTAPRSLDHGNYKTSRPPPPTIPLVRIRKTTVSSIRPPAGLTITPRIPTTTSLPTAKTSTTISKTLIPNKVVPVTESDDRSKEETNQEQCGVMEEEQPMRHDDIGALDLSGKSSRCKTASSPVTSPTVATGFSSPPSPVLKSTGGTVSSTHQSILSIAQSLVHRQLQQQQQQHGLINISSSSSGKVSKSPGTDNLGASVHPTVVTTPVYAMSNLKTLSDTAVRIRNEMAAQSDKTIRSGGNVKSQLQQKPAALSVQMTSASEAGAPASLIGRSPIAVTYASNSNPRSSVSHPPTRSPTSHQQYQSLPNNSIPPLRIPIPPTALSKTSSPTVSNSRSSSVPRLHELYPSTQGAMGRGRSIVTGLQNRSGLNNQSKPGPNQGVRHIPNPSALLFRQQQTQNRHAAVTKALFNNQNNFNNTTVKPGASTSIVQAAAAAPPVSSIRKMENMTRNIEKVAAGLTVRAVEAHSK